MRLSETLRSSFFASQTKVWFSTQKKRLSVSSIHNLAEVVIIIIMNIIINVNISATNYHYFTPEC